MVELVGLVERAWQSYRTDVLSPDAPDEQVSECRTAFYGGATALYTTIMRRMDPGSEPTQADMDLMASIDRELREFARELGRGTT